VDSLFDTPLLTIPQAQKLRGVTYRSANQNIQNWLRLVSSPRHHAKNPENSAKTACHLKQASGF
jgi:hypothetical protein